MEHTVYKVRWVILAMVCVLAFVTSYVDVCFDAVGRAGQPEEQSNGNPGLISMHNISPSAMCLVLVFAATAIGIRAQSITIAVCALVAAVASMCGIMWGRIEWMYALGRALVGICNGILYVLAVNLANNWFPVSEVATAFSLPMSFYWVGAVVAFTVSLEFQGVPGSTLSNSTGVTVERAFANNKIILGNGVVLIVLTFLLTVFFCIHSRNNPPSPPTFAEENLLHDRDSSAEEAPTWRKYRSHLSEILKIASCRSFLCITAANFLACASLQLVAYISPYILHISFPDMRNKTTAYIRILAVAAAAFGGIVAGRLLDKFGKFKEISLAGTVAMIITCGGIHIGHYFESLATLFALYPVLLFFRVFTIITYVEFMVDTTYPYNKITLASLHFFFYFLGLFTFGSLEKIAADMLGPQYAILVASVANLAAFFLLLVVVRDYKRSEVNVNGEREKYDDTTTASESEQLLPDE